MLGRTRIKIIMKNILITGGSGFIGSNMIYYLFNKYDHIKIVNVDKITYAGRGDNLQFLSEKDKIRYSFYQLDISSIGFQERLDEIVSLHEIDTIIHFAAESHVDRSISNPEEFVLTNILGTYNILQVVKKRGIRFHHISTDEVFGHLSPKDNPFDENTPYFPRSPYSASKAASDHLVRSYSITYGIKATISNCSNNYGPFQFPEKMVPLFITNLLEGRNVPVYGDGNNIRDWIYVKDHCSAIDLIIREGEIGETYCIGGGNEISNLKLTEKILDLMYLRKDMIDFVPDRAGHDFRYAIDYSKINSKLGWEPKKNFDEGLKETIEWYTNNKDWWKKLK